MEVEYLGINYICKTHRENEAERKNKPKLCYSRIEKIKISVKNKEEFRYYFRINHSLDEKYIKARNADLNEWINRLQSKENEKPIGKEADGVYIRSFPTLLYDVSPPII